MHGALLCGGLATNFRINRLEPAFLEYRGLFFSKNKVNKGKTAIILYSRLYTIGGLRAGAVLKMVKNGGFGWMADE